MIIHNIIFVDYVYVLLAFRFQCYCIILCKQTCIYIYTYAHTVCKSICCNTLQYIWRWQTQNHINEAEKYFFLGEGGIGFPWSFTADAGCHGLRIVGCWSTALKENTKVKGNQHTKIF